MLRIAGRRVGGVRRESVGGVVRRVGCAHQEFVVGAAGGQSPPYARSLGRARGRRGLTLIELLVVISIMMVLAVIAIRSMGPGMEERRIREAARGVNVFISSARFRAIENGRPFGVRFERDPNLLLAGVTLTQVEVPPPYAGDAMNSKIVIAGGPPAQVAFTAGENPSLLVSAGVIQRYDRLRLDYRGPDYTIMDITGPQMDQWTLSPPPPATPATGLPFQIMRQPVRSSVAPLQMPNGVVVDLQFSGTATMRFSDATANPAPVTIMFNTSGSVDYAMGHTLGPTGRMRVTQPLYLLVGRRDKVPLVPGGTTETEEIDGLGPIGNERDPRNIWVSLNPQTGHVVCAEVNPGAPNDLVTSRSWAREFHSMGGR